MVFVHKYGSHAGHMVAVLVGVTGQQSVLRSSLSMDPRVHFERFDETPDLLARHSSCRGVYDLGAFYAVNGNACACGFRISAVLPSCSARR
jgi:hypothetical protein